MLLLSELLPALRRHWSCYLAEAAGLAFFMTCSGLLTLALEHPASPLHQWLVAQGVGPMERRVPLGLGMGLVIVALIHNPWGKRSGAHINPAVTLAFWQLGKIRRADALWYGLAQAAGGIGMALLLKRLLGSWYAHPSFHYGTTRPGPGGPWLAFGAEFIISFVVMGVLLVALHSARLQKLAGWLVGALLVSYIIWESPYSGMSLNPFRSLASDVAAGEFDYLWVYLLAPSAAMWLATVLFQRFYLARHAQPTKAIPTPPTAPDLAGLNRTEPPVYPDLSAA